MVLAAQRKAAYDHAESDRTAAHAQWQAKSQSRQKELRKQSRPTDYGAQATKHRQQSAVLLSRHADREQERRQTEEDIAHRVVLDRACVSRVLDRLIRKLENQQKRTSSGEQGRLQSGQTHHSAWSLSAWVSHTMQASYSVSAIDIATSGLAPQKTMSHTALRLARSGGTFREHAFGCWMSGS